MTDTTPITATLTGTVMTAFSDWSQRALAKLRTLPFWADSVIVCTAIFLILTHLGVINLNPTRDTVTQTEFAGIASALNEIKADIKTAAKEAACVMPPASIATGSITKPKR